MKLIQLLLFCALLGATGSAFAQANLTWQLTSPDGTVTYDSPELDVTAAGETLKHYERFIRWSCTVYPPTDVDGNPLPCFNGGGSIIPGRAATSFNKWATEQWQVTRTNVLTWERQQRFDAASDGPDLE